jgi:hypothetical protein
MSLSASLMLATLNYTRFVNYWTFIVVNPNRMVMAVIFHHPKNGLLMTNVVE